MEQANSCSDENTNDERRIIYEKGYPFYRLSRREFSPSMNLLKTFDTKRPHIMNIAKDMSKNKWSPYCTSSFLLILQDVEIFAKNIRFTSCQTAALMEMFYSCFQYFIMLPSLEKHRFMEYFRDTLVLYSVHDPAESLRIFNATECFAIVKLFHELVANNFEMMKYVLVPIYRIEIEAKQKY